MNLEERKQIERQRLELAKKMLEDPKTSDKDATRLREKIQLTEDFLNTPTSSPSDETIETLVRYRANRWRVLRILQTEMTRLDDAIITQEYTLQCAKITKQIGETETKIKTLDTAFILPALEVDEGQEDQALQTMLEETKAIESQTLAGARAWKTRQGL